MRECGRFYSPIKIRSLSLCCDLHRCFSSLPCLGETEWLNDAGVHISLILGCDILLSGLISGYILMLPQ